jgi:putative DNA primase/helicase
MNLREAARALHGEVCGRRVLCPGPGHSPADRSMSVWLDGGALRVHSFANDDWRDCDAYARQRLGLPEWKGDGRRDRHKPPPRPKAPTKPERDFGPLARNTWRETIDPRGTLAETHFKNRGLRDCIDDTLAMTVRYHGNCPFKVNDRLERAPAIICAIRSAYATMCACGELGELETVERKILTDVSRVISIQRIRLTEDGAKVGKGDSLGTMGDDGVIFLAPLYEIYYNSKVTISEGLETGLSMRAFGHIGNIALAGGGRLKKFTPPHHWGEITISGENDKGASRTAWEAAGARISALGHDVSVWFPPDGYKDANDVLRPERRQHD